MHQYDAALLSELKSVLRYDPETGHFWWLKGIGRPKTRPAGTATNATGHIGIKYFVARYLAHRLAVAFMTGRWPVHTVDHIDGDPTNNAWSNLREATHAENIWNKRGTKGAAVPYKGVSLWRNKNSGATRFRVQIETRGKAYHIGYFDDVEAAARAYDKKAIEMFGEFAKTNFPRDKAA